MELVYQGFDGLDVSYQARIGQRLSEALEVAKTQAQKYRRGEYLEWNGARMLVSECGARGGYAYTVRTENPGAIWFFKKPNRSDPWGVRVSCGSFQLAVHGLRKTRDDIMAALARLEIAVPVSGESIGRVASATDFLAPAFALEPTQFVMHSNCQRAAQYSDMHMRSDGTSGRITSITVGKMPGRQIIVYDKRAEVISKRKVAWFAIWDEARKRDGRPCLDYCEPSESRIWRVELRAGKKHLKDHWAIRTWEDLDARLGDVFSQAINAVRYTTPITDSNRSRWPTHPLWVRLKAALDDGLFDYRSFVSAHLVKRVQRQAFDELLCGQMAGLLISRAALSDLGFDDIENFTGVVCAELYRKIATNRNRYEKQLIRTQNRYDFT